MPPVDKRLEVKSLEVGLVPSGGKSEFEGRLDGPIG